MNVNVSSMWIGLNDMFGEGRFLWRDGTQYQYTNWKHGEPNSPGYRSRGANVRLSHLSISVKTESKRFFLQLKSLLYLEIVFLNCSLVQINCYGFNLKLQSVNRITKNCGVTLELV